MARLSPPPGADGTMALRFTPADRGGDRVIIADHVTIGVPNESGERVLIDDFTGFLARGEVLGLIGPNGAGKSTFLRTLLGEREASSGELRLGGSVTAAYYRQDLSQVPLDRPLYEVIADMRPMWERRLVQGHLGRFGFSGDEAVRRAESLSGGERARVALAMLMLGRANLLILDEPTNHLDVESIETLEDAIEDYDGTVILVSHDRALLRALTTRVWVMHGTHVTDFPGGFDEWEVVAAERAHAAQVQASEEESLRRVRERQKTARTEKGNDDRRGAVRNARRAVEEAEAEVARLEERVASLTKRLEDPALYTRAGGVAESSKLGAELDREKARLDAGLLRWTTATEQLERLTSSRAT